ncbi:hypothetical protein AWN76_005855 [Rhodothermaceae bacterium RA]|nr:hypothetical protein AWN76_005855 [Rhodothermaceae bacterium RA]
MSTALHLDLFLQAGRDIEGAQYRVLSGLQRIQQAFSRNVIYPHLAELIELYGTLKTIAGRIGDLRGAVPKRITGVDLQAGEVTYEASASFDQMAYVEELIHWALPHIQKAIEEGRTIYEFVEEHLHMEEVGIVPSYVQEGYLILPDPDSGQTHILQYTLSVFTSAEARYRSLQTSHLKSLPHRGVYPSPGKLKLDLAREYPDLPNPATYFFSTDLDFPYEPTTLPVAKRKLMRYLFRQAGRA